MTSIDMSARARAPRKNCSLDDSRPKPPKMWRAAKGRRRMRPIDELMLSTMMPRRSSAAARLHGAPDHVRGSRGGPKMDVIAIRSNRKGPSGEIIIGEFGTHCESGTASIQRHHASAVRQQTKYHLKRNVSGRRAPVINL
ncbi:MAG TPA: hypothetical protein VMU87_14670 [Stellaceae bacterium]|nr:hypothetical protein [Stellaceae bacterium]